MGDDDAIVQAARVSYGRGTKRVQEDAGLIRYLMRHRHTTPFEMCEIKFHVKLPIFVARQWIRHRTASVNDIRRATRSWTRNSTSFARPPGGAVDHQPAGPRRMLEGDEAAEVLDLLRSDAERCYVHYARC